MVARLRHCRQASDDTAATAWIVFDPVRHCHPPLTRTMTGRDLTCRAPSCPAERANSAFAPRPHRHRLRSRYPDQTRSRPAHSDRPRSSPRRADQRACGLSKTLEIRRGRVPGEGALEPRKGAPVNPRRHPVRRRVNERLDWNLAESRVHAVPTAEKLEETSKTSLRQSVQASEAQDRWSGTERVAPRSRSRLRSDLYWTCSMAPAAATAAMSATSVIQHFGNFSSAMTAM